jgi:hypothetical protein
MLEFFRVKLGVIFHVNVIKNCVENEPKSERGGKSKGVDDGKGAGRG